MQQVQPVSTLNLKEYVIFLKFINNSLYAGLADGSIWSVNPQAQVVPKGAPLVGVCNLNSELCFARTDGVIGSLNLSTSNLREIKAQYPLSSIATRNDLIVCGTELKKPDAGILVYKLDHENPIREYMDSHADDVTDVRFHPTEENVLISGSTDGTVNLYDLNVEDPDETIFQSINHDAAIHRTDFLGNDTFFALSQMEDLSLYQVTTPDDQGPEPHPVGFGDLREAWGCEYVADFNSNYFLIGSNNNETLKLVPFVNDQPLLISAYNLVGAHGDDVVRCFEIAENTLYTGGEDGSLKVWHLPQATEEPKQHKQKHSKKHKHTSKHSKKSNPY